MVVSLNRGTAIKIPKYCNPYQQDPQNGTANFGNPHIGGGLDLKPSALRFFEL